MNRVTPEQIKAAYEQTGLLPLRNAYAGYTAKSRRCGCPLFALAAAKGMPMELGKEPGDSVYVLAFTIGLPAEYATGFMEAWDGYTKPTGTCISASEGFSDGKKAKRAFIEDRIAILDGDNIPTPEDPVDWD